MAVPLDGDPRRPLHLAASSCRVLGALVLLATTCMGVPLFTRLGGGVFPTRFVPLTIGLYGIGAAYFVFAHHIRRRRTWAVVAALCLTGVVTLPIAAALAFAVARAIAAMSGGGAPSAALGFLSIPVLVLAALGQLIYHLIQSMSAIRWDPPDEARGFDVLPVAVVPTDPLDGPA